MPRPLTFTASMCAVVLSLAGCGEVSSTPAENHVSPPAASRSSATNVQDVRQHGFSPAANDASLPGDTARAQAAASLTRALEQTAQTHDTAAPAARETATQRAVRNIPPPRTIRDEQMRQAGVRRIEGRHLALYTDLPSSPAVDELAEVFDAAHAEWCEYFGIDPATDGGWRMNGFLMGNRQRFLESGLLPATIPQFLHGFSANHELWLNEQPSDYYRRHLLLHEGTHGFMNTHLGHCGPPWYMEATAELLGTHRWVDGQLTLGAMPRNREEVEMLGRIKLVQQAVEQGRTMTLREIAEYGPEAHLVNEPYAWCWAAAALLDGHPRYRDRFRDLQTQVLMPDFNSRYHARFKDDWPRLSLEWKLFIHHLEHGHDIAGTALDMEAIAQAEPLAASAAVQVAADRGWQSSGLRLEEGKTYSLQAEGRYQVADQPTVWWCEPGGVSIRYYQGQPLGILLAAVVPAVVDDATSQQAADMLLNPRAIGLQAELSPDIDGVLMLRINDSWGELHDNAGTLRVDVHAAE